MDDRIAAHRRFRNLRRTLTVAVLCGTTIAVGVKAHRHLFNRVLPRMLEAPANRPKTPADARQQTRPVKRYA